MAAKKSLNFRLICTIGLFSFFILTALSALILKVTVAEIEYRIDQEVAALAGALEVSAVSDVTAKNVSQLEFIAKKILEDKTIDAITFYDQDSRVLTAQTSSNKPDARGQIKNHFIKNPSAANTLGKMEIKYNYSEAEGIYHKFLIIVSIGVIAGMALFSLAIYFVVHKSMKKINEITQKLRTLVLETNQSSQSVQKISEQVSESSTEQATAIQETVSTLDEISSQVSATVDNVAQSAQKAEESLKIASEGNSVMQEMMASMGAISTSNEEIMSEISKGNERIAGIVKIINEISQKTTVINDIVFQTKLLSFNASVEAARAGEHGKGFAVVAEEVGNLAQMSGRASTEINDILNDSIVKVNSVIDETNTNVKRLVEVGNQKISSGVAIADRCAKALHGVVENAEIVKNMMNEISVATKEQAEGVKNITSAMNQLDQATLHNNKAAVQTSADAKTLSTQSSSLSLAVESLEVELLGGKQTESRPAAPKDLKITAKKGMEKGLKKELAQKFVAQTTAKDMPQAPIKEKKAAPVIVETKKGLPPKEHASPQKEDLKISKAHQALPAHNDPRFEDV